MSGAPVYWSQPNQQVVRNGDPVGIISDDPDPQTASKDEPFDPGDHTVDEVNAYLEDNPDDEKRVLRAERAGKARVGVLGE